MRWCFLRSPDSLKLLSHTSHWKGFSSVCPGREREDGGGGGRVESERREEEGQVKTGKNKMRN